jgi:hypothetical protein
MYKALGINVFVNLVNGPSLDQMAQVRAAGLYAIAGLENNDPGITAHFYLDEPDINPANCTVLPDWLKAHCQNGSTWYGGQQILASSVRAMNNVIRTHDPSRPIYMQYTKSIARGGGFFESIAMGDKSIYALASDILSFDHYMISDLWAPGPVWLLYDETKQARGYAANSRPVWVFIELSRVFADTRVSVTPEQVRAEVWNALIGGARGIEYFNHNFFRGVIPGDPAAQGCTEHLLTDTRYAQMSQMVLSINERIHSLAPVLNSPFIKDYVTTNLGNRISVMAKRFASASNFENYIFAIPHARGTQQVVFTLEGETKGLIEVIGEGRTLKLNSGRFSDVFRNENEVHIYRLKP